MPRFWACCLTAVLILGCSSAGKSAELPPAAAPVADAPGAEGSASPAPQALQPVSAAEHASAPPPDRVADGEDLWKLVGRFKTSAIELLLVNGLGPDDASKIIPGMRVVVPGVVRKLDGTLIWLPHPKEAAAQQRAKELDLGKVGTASKLLFGHMEDRWIEAAGGPQLSGTLNWPVAGGRYVRGYGSGQAGYHLAVDVAGPTGWPARGARLQLSAIA